MPRLLDCEKLLFSYGDAPVLGGVSLSLNSGEVVALLGPNGSGKSTLIRVLLGQLRASGTVRWEDRELRDWPRRQLARRVAYLPQMPTWEAEQRVSDVLRMGRAPYLSAFGVESQRDVEVVREVAKTLALTDLLSRRMDQLSGGQRQRVFVGRCLVQEPQAMLLDEPNTYLDLRHQVELGRLLIDLAGKRNLGVLMASHDLNLAAMFADRLILLENGTIAADGSPDQVLRPDILSRVYGIPMQRLARPGGVYVFPEISR
jgi:iron complex transport system ATP-binding protein